MKNFIDLTLKEPRIHPALKGMRGDSPAEGTLAFTNHYMEKNSQPYFGICGEFHFSRYDARDWDDELLKMKMGGINIVPTYIFWNHHEEVKGSFDWTGNRNLRRFVTLCQKHHLFVILRVGPFDHGECRNGGFPDWLYGEPCEVRKNDPRYLFYVRRLYHEIGKQTQGLYYKDGGPIIGVQLENEYCHSAAAWEITTGTSGEWIPNGTYDGDKEKHHEHIATLKRIAQEEGIVAPFYTGTGWGGAEASPDQVLPLWGGYAFWPWIFYDKSVTKHPATPEYIYRDYRKPTYNFAPTYDPTEVPFACCEMGGGMTVFYDYRFRLPYESVDAMGNVKVASGCNFVGYYVYHGGSNPRGKLTPYLNENETPKISYDYQAPLGEFGEVRPSYHRLRRQHYFFSSEERSFCPMQTVLPEGAEDIAPEDTRSLRFAVRHRGESGYLFLNNYQDHLEQPDKTDEHITLQLPQGEITIPAQEEPGLTLAGGESCILPFGYTFAPGLTLTYATAQLLTHFEKNGCCNYFFYAPDGMTPSYCFPVGTAIEDLQSVTLQESASGKILHADRTSLSRFTLTAGGKKIRVYTLTTEQSLCFWQFDMDGEPQALLTDATLLAGTDGIRLEAEGNTVELADIDGLLDPRLLKNTTPATDAQGLLHFHRLTQKKQTLPCAVETIAPGKYLLKIESSALRRLKDARLAIHYTGDIGYAFVANTLVSDNYANGEVWDIGLKHNIDAAPDAEIYLNITPIRKGATVKNDSPMAARSEENEGEIVSLDKAEIIPVYEFEL